MASNLACIGVRVTSAARVTDFVADILPLSTRMGTVGDVTTYRWQDGSGARLVIGLRDNEVVDFVPSFAAAEGVRFTNLRPLNDDVVAASVVDDDGRQLTDMAFQLEQRRVLTDVVTTPRSAALVAFGRDVEVFEDEAALAASPRGWPATFVSDGVSGDPEDAEPTARFSGTVLTAARLTNEHTGREFIACRVRCSGFEFDLLLDAQRRSRLPASGAVVAGTVFLVASIASLGFGRRL